MVKGNRARVTPSGASSSSPATPQGPLGQPSVSWVIETPNAQADRLPTEQLRLQPSDGSRRRTRLEITVLEAAARGEHGSFKTNADTGGSHDCYVLVTVAPTRGKLRTERSAPTPLDQKPRWEAPETWTFENITSRHAEVTLVLKEKIRLGFDEEIGSVTFRLGQLRWSKEACADEWHALSEGGRLRLRMSWCFASVRAPSDKDAFKLRQLPFELVGSAVKDKAVVDADVPPMPSGEYTVIVHVIEARDVVGTDASGVGDVCVSVECFGSEERTDTVNDSRRPVFDDTLFFNTEHATAKKIGVDALKVVAYDMNALGRKSCIGQTSIELSYLYFVCSKMMRRRWLALADPCRPDEGVQGFVLVSAQIVGPGDALRPMTAPPDEGDDGAAAEEQEESVMMSPALKQESAFLVVAVQRAVHLPKMDTLSSYFSMAGAKEIDARFCISFNGQHVHTLTLQSRFPEWRTEFWLPVTLPSCGARIRLSVVDVDLGELRLMGRQLASAQTEVVGSFSMPFDNVEEVDEPEATPWQWVELLAPLDRADPAASAGGLWRGAVLLRLSSVRQAARPELEHMCYMRDLPPLPGAAEPPDDEFFLRFFALSAVDLSHGQRFVVEVRWGQYTWETQAVRADDTGCCEFRQELRQQSAPSAPAYSGGSGGGGGGGGGGGAGSGTGSATSRLLDTLKSPFASSPSKGGKGAAATLPSDVLGRLPRGTAAVRLPAMPPEELPPVMLYLTKDGERVAFEAIPAAELLQGRGKASRSAWREFAWVDPKLWDERAPRPLLRVDPRLVRADEHDDVVEISRAQLPPPLPRAPLELRLHLYCVKGLEQGCDCMVRIKHAGHEAHAPTRQVRGTTVDWFQTIVLHVPDALPPSDGPDVVVSVWDDDWMMADKLLGVVRIPLREAMQPTRGATGELPPLPDPTWRGLTARDGNPASELDASLLISLEAEVLPPPTAKATAAVAAVARVPRSPSLRPPTKQLFLQFTVIGVRGLRPHGIMPPAHKPHLELSVGNDRTAQSYARTPRSSLPSARNPNFLHNVQMPVQMPLSPLFCPPLNVRVRDDLLGGLSTLTLGHAEVPLVEIWSKMLARGGGAPAHEAVAAKSGEAVTVLVQRQRFDLKLGEWLPPRSADPLPEWADLKGKATTKKQARLRGEHWEWAGAWTVAAASGGADGGDCDAQGWRYSQGFKATTWSSEAADGCPGVRMRRWERLQRKRSKAHELAEAVAAAQAALAKEPKDGDAEESKDPTIPLWRRGRARMEQPLECYFEHQPFEAYEVTAEPGGTKRVGTLNGLLELHEEPLPPSTTLKSILSPRTCEVRLYVLEATELMPADTNGASDPYLKVRLGDETQDSRDAHLSSVTSAGFYTTFTFGAYLPGASLLSVEVWDYDLIGSDDLIGATEIDLENRIYCDEWKALKLAPIETRPLFCKKSKHPQGRIELFVDIVDMETPLPKRHPKWDIALPPQQEWELRVAVWKTYDVVPFDTVSDMNDMYAAVVFGREIMRTDTHWRCRKGKGSFNWRCNFPLTLDAKPCLNHRLTVQLWDRDILTANDFIGAHTLDLSPWLQECFWQFGLGIAEQEHHDATGGSDGGRGQTEPDAEPRQSDASLRKTYSSKAIRDQRRSAAHVHEKPKAFTNQHSFHFVGGGFDEPPKPHGRAILEQVVTAFKEGEGNESVHPLLGASGVVQKFWLPCLGPEGTNNGWVRLSVELVSKKLAEAKPAGQGRTEPNAWPKLPEPQGRVALSLNPFKNIEALIGPKLARRLSCACCCVCCCGLLVFLLTMGLPAMLGSSVSALLLGGSNS